MKRPLAVLLTTIMVLSPIAMSVGGAALTSAGPATTASSSGSMPVDMAAQSDNAAPSMAMPPEGPSPTNAAFSSDTGPEIAAQLDNFEGVDNSAGKSLQLGGQSWGTVADHPSQDFVSGTFTLELWVKPDDSSQENAKILRQGTDGGWYLEWTGTGDERPISFVTDDCCDIGLTSEGGVPADVWTHIALVYDGSQLSLYINGELDATSSNNNDASGQGDLHIGSNAANNDNFYSGRIDNIRFWDTNRNFIAIQDDRYKELSGSETDLSALYQFDDDSSSGPGVDLVGEANISLTGRSVSIVDDDSNPVAPHIHTTPLNSSVKITLDPRNNQVGANDADSFNIYRSTSSDPTTASLVTNVVTFTDFFDEEVSNGQTYYYWATAVVSGSEGDISKAATARPYGETTEAVEIGPDGGQGGRSLTLGSGQNWGTLTDRPSQDLFLDSDNAFTVEFWVKPEADSDANAKILRQGTDSGWYIDWVGTGEERPVRFVTDDCCDIGLTSDSGVQAGVWTHVAFTYDGSQLAVYINGELDATMTDNSNDASGQGDLHIGSNAANNADFFRGQLDELRLWNAHRSTSAIQGNYTSELVGSESNLNGYWQFDTAESSTTSGMTYRHGTISLTGRDAGITEGGAFPVGTDTYTENGNSSVTVSWDDRTDDSVSSYKVWRKPASGGVSDWSLIERVTDTVNQTYVDASASNGQNYDYAVTAVDIDGQESDLPRSSPGAPYEDRGGGSLTFDGTSNAEFSDRPSQDFINDKFTVEFWVKPEASSDADAKILRQGTDSGWYIDWVGTGEERPIRFFTDDCCDIGLTSDSGVQAGVWTHVAFTYDGSQLAVYINGELDATTSDNNDASGQGDLRIGSNAAGGANFYAGQVDEVAFWNDDRTGDELSRTYDGSYLGNESNLVHYWQFDSQGAATARATTDSHATISLDDPSATLAAGGALPVGTDTYTANGNGSVTVAWDDRSNNSVSAYDVWRKPASGSVSDWSLVERVNDTVNQTYVDANASNGQNYSYAVTTIANDSQESDFPRGSPGAPYDDLGGSALSLDGSSYGELSDRPSFDFISGEFTVEFWVKPEAGSDENAYIVRSGGSDGWGVEWVGTGEERAVRFFTDDCCDIDLTSDSGVPAGEWTHVAFTYDGNQLAVYINGELDATVANNNDAGGSGNITLGSNVAGGANFYAGQIDEVAFWNDGRTKQELSNTYDDTYVGNESGLVHYWQFDSRGVAAGRATTDSHATVNLKETAELTAPGVDPVPPRVYARAEAGLAEVSWRARNFDTTDEVRLYDATQRDLGDRGAVATVDAGLRSTYSATGLANGSTRFYQATAINSQGQESDYAFEAGALPSTQPSGDAFRLTGAANSSHGTLSGRPSFDFINDEFTVELWVKPEAGSEENAKILRQGTDNGWYLEWTGTGDERPVSFVTDDCCDIGLTSNTDLQAGEWTHVAFTYDGNQLAVYINGELEATTSDNNDASGQGDLTLGSNQAKDGNFLKGNVDGIRLWDDHRTKAEITDNYDNELSGSEQGLVGYWRGPFTTDTNSVTGSADRPMTMTLNNVRAVPSRANVQSGGVGTTSLDVTLDGASNGLQFYEVRINTTTGNTIRSITPVLLSSSQVDISAGGPGSQTVTVRGSDLTDQVGSFSGERDLFRIEYASNVSREDISLTVITLTDDSGASIDTGKVTYSTVFREAGGQQNQPPVANRTNISTSQGTPVTGSFDATDPDGNLLTYSIVKAPQNGSVTISGDQFTYTPNSGFTGTDTFTYQASDGNNGTDTATVEISVGSQVGTGITVSPTPRSVSTSPGRTVTVDIEASNVSNGVRSYEFNVTLTNTSVATITGVQLVGTSQSNLGTDVAITGGGSRLSVSAAQADHNNGVIATVTLTAQGTGSAQLNLFDVVIGDNNFANYSIARTPFGTITVAQTTAPPPVVGNNNPQDPDGDGTYEDITGDGRVNILDVGAFLSNRRTSAVQNNVDAFDFTGDGRVNILDVGKLLQQVL